MKFRDFLLNENTAYLSQKVSDILDALQDLTDNSGGMGTRHLIKNAEIVVNQIRKVLHTHWPKRDEQTLRSLQKVGVAILKSIDQKSDLEAVLQGCVEELQGTLSNLDMPINRLASPEGKPAPKAHPKEQEQLAEPQGKQDKKPEPPQQVPPGPMPPPMPPIQMPFNAGGQTPPSIQQMPFGGAMPTPFA